MVSTSPRLCCSSCSRLSGGTGEAGLEQGKESGGAIRWGLQRAQGGGPVAGTQGKGKWRSSWATGRGVAGMKGVA